MDILVIGAGQRLRGDDRAGLAAVSLWQDMYPNTASDPRVVVESIELPGLALLNLLETAQAAIIVDAVQSGAQPGKLHRLNPQQLAAFQTDSKSAHGWGISETLTLGKKLGIDPLPGEIVLLGIEAVQFTPGAELSPAVKASLPAAAIQIEAQVQAWLCSRPAQTQRAEG